MSNYTPVLDPGVGEQQNPGATAFYNKNIYYIGNGHNSKIWVLTRSTSSIEPNEDPSDEARNWSQSVLDDGPGFKEPIGYSAATNQQPAAAIAGDNLYFVWIQDDSNDLQPSNSVWATQLSAATGGQESGWSQPVRLLDQNGSPLSIDQSNFAMLAWGNYLVGCYSSATQTCFLVYDADDWPELPQESQSTWSAIAAWQVDFTSWTNFPPQAELGNQISMDWFSTAGTPPSPQQPAIYYIVSFYNSSNGTAYLLHAMNVLPFAQWTGQPFQQWQVEQWTGLSAGVSIIRDPGGRVRAYHGDSGNNLNVRILATDPTSADGYLWDVFGSPALLYKQNTEIGQTPVPAFVLGPPTPPSPDITRQVYEFVLFPTYGEKHISVEFAIFGKAVQSGQPLELKLSTINTGAQQHLLIVNGIVDSVLPMPASNIVSRPTSYSAQLLGEVAYGTTQTVSDQVQTSWSWSAGIVSTEKSTKGVGPAWNISFSAGTSGATGASSTTQNVMQSIASTNVGLTNKQLLPYGVVFSAGVTFYRDSYTFYDLLSDGDQYMPAGQ